MSTMFRGVDHDRLADVLASGVDDGGNPIEPFVDDEGGWPLRCCLRSSAAGERIAIIAWSPFEWTGAYRETGPVVVHADPCPAPVAELTQLPDAIATRPMVLRPYSHDHRIVYDLVTHLPVGGRLAGDVERLLDDPRVAEVHGRNWTGGCFAFSARRAG